MSGNSSSENPGSAITCALVATEEMAELMQDNVFLVQWTGLSVVENDIERGAGHPQSSRTPQFGRTIHFRGGLEQDRPATLLR